MGWAILFLGRAGDPTGSRPCRGSPWGSASCLEVGVIRIEIGNRKRGADGHYIGRPSPLGNPFRLHSEAERDDVIAKYAAWLEARLQEGDEAVRRELNRLYMEAVRRGSLRLVCWCSPRRCHAEVIAQKLATVLQDRGHEVEIVYL